MVEGQNKIGGGILPQESAYFLLFWLIVFFGEINEKLALCFINTGILGIMMLIEFYFQQLWR